MRQSMRYIVPISITARTHADGQRSKSSSLCKSLLCALLLTQHTIVPRFLDPASPLDFRKRKAERHSGAKLLNRMAVHDGMAKADVEAEVILHLPDRTDEARHGSRLTDFLFVEEFGDRSDLPLRGPLDDASHKDVGMIVARELGDDVSVHRSPIPALGYDRAEARTETTVCVKARQQRPEFDCNARSTGVLEAPFSQHVLEKCADAVDARVFVRICQRELSLTLKHEFPVFCKAIIEDRKRRDQRRLGALA